MKRKTFTIIFWTLGACVLVCTAFLDFSQYAESTRTENRVQVFLESAATFDGVDADGDSVQLLKLPVHYALGDSVAAITEVVVTLASWAARNPRMSIARDTYEYRDEYFENDSTTIVTAEYYVVEPTPIGYK